MNDFGKTVVAILLGWLLGLLSPPIVELIQRRHRRSELGRSLFIELEGLRLSLAVLTYQQACCNGTVNRQLLELLEPILRSDKIFPEIRGVADVVSSMMKLTDEQIASALATKDGNFPIGLKKLAVSFLTAQLSSLSIFPPEFQRLALKVSSRVAIINEEIDSANFQYQKTFESLSPQNHAIVVENLRQSHQNLERWSRPLIDDVDSLLAMKK